jgi:hypothetical protein
MRIDRKPHYARVAAARAAARQAAEVALPSATGTRGGCLLLRRVKACRAARSLEEKSDGVYWDRDLKPKCG